jgi:hypothetical protein
VYGTPGRLATAPRGAQVQHDGRRAGTEKLVVAVAAAAGPKAATAVLAVPGVVSSGTELVAEVQAAAEHGDWR